MTSEFEDDPGVSLYVGSISDKVTEDLLWELFVQAGPVANVKIPVDASTRTPKGFAFVQFVHAVSGDFAIRLLHDTPLCGRNIVVRASHRGNATSVVSPANTYAAAKTQLEGLQQQMISHANAMRQSALNSVQSPSVLGAYRRGGTQPAAIPYHTPRHDAPAAASSAPSSSSPMPAHSRYTRSPDRQAPYGGRPPSAERPSSHPGRGHAGYDRPAERRYSRDEPQQQHRGYERDRDDRGTPSRHDADRGYARDDYSSYDGYAPGRGEPSSSHHGGHHHSHSQQPQRGYEMPPDRHAGPSSSSRYHPYGRAEPAQQQQRQYHNSSAPPRPDPGQGSGQYRQYDSHHRQY